MSGTLTIDFGGGTTQNNATNYDDSAALNPTTTLFSSAAISTSNGTGNNLTGLVLQLSGPSATETLSLTTAAAAAATAAGITFSYNSVTGVVTFAHPAGGNGPASSTWNTILRGLQYTDTADQANGTTHTLTVVSATNNSGSAPSITDPTATETITVTCFYRGTRIATPDGEVAVETLKPGDLVRLADGGTAPVRWLGRQTISMFFADKARVLPIRVKAGALGDAVPARDLLLSPDHALFVDGALIQAGALVNGTSIVRETMVPRVFPYYHVELDSHALVLAEGAPAESFVDNLDRLGFDNWAEHEALYPQGRAIEELPYPRAKSHRQVPVYVRVMLAGRAEAIGGATAAA